MSRTRADISAALTAYDSEKVLKRLGATGYVLPSVPASGEEPQIPDNMDLMPPQDLRELHARFAAWQSYLNGLMAYSIAVVNSLREIKAVVEAALNTEIQDGSKKDRLKDRQYAVVQDARYIDINARLVEEESFLAGLKARIAKSELDLQSISRQITIALGVGQQV